MNMHGFIALNERETMAQRNTVKAIYEWLREKRIFLLIVVLPIAIVGIYLFLISSDQYESEAHIIVRSSRDASTPGIGVSSALSMVTGMSAAQNEAMSVADYLTSHDAVDSLRKNDRLVERFHRADADFLSKLRQKNPTPEGLLKYFRRQAKVKYDTETGITTIAVRSFRPQDSYDIVRDLIQLGERRVNTLNVRSFNDSLAMARRQLAEAENALAASQTQLTQFRQTRGDIDPQASGAAQIGLVSTLNEQLAVSRAQLETVGRMIDHSSPQYRALASRVGSLQAQVASQSGRLTGGKRAIALNVGGYQSLQLRQEFLAKRYDAAAAAVERARDQAQRQQLYLVRVVQPNMPVKALYPERFRILITIAIALMLVYSIGWLIVAGVREHAA